MKSSVAILALFLASAAVADGFDVTGQILGINRGEWGWILLAEDVQPNNFNVYGREIPDCRSGDIVRAQGFTRPGTNGKIDFIATNVVHLGRRPLPKTSEIAGWQINDPALYHRCVRIRGTVSSVRKDDTNKDWNQLTLRTPSGKVCAVTQEEDGPIDTLRRLINADVVLSGYISSFGAFHNFLGNELLLFGTNGIAVAKAADPDPFAAPPLTDRNVLHRQRIEGTVIGIDRERIYLKTEVYDFLPVVPSDGAPRPLVGTRVTAVGFAEHDMRDFQLADALVRPEEGPPLPLAEPRDMSPESLFSDSSGNETIDTTVYGRPIRVQGHVANTSNNIRRYQSLYLSCGSRTIVVDVSQLGPGFNASDLADCTVSVAGLCIPAFERDAASSWIPRFTGFRLIPRTAMDIRVLARPPWWTPFRLLCVIGALLLCIAVILVWNITLRVMSERRGVRLAHETIGRIKSDLKVEERTRLAVELHDSISQTLTGVALQVDSATTANAAANSAVDRYLGLARQMLASCRMELQGCLWDLRGRTFEEKDLNEAILRAIGPQTGNARLTVRFNVPREAISETTLHTLLRITREMVVNAVRHGKASDIRIAGELKDGILRFSVCDNGCGFIPAEAPSPALGHFGLRGIRERLAQFDGTLEVASQPGQGAKFTVTMNTNEERES